MRPWSNIASCVLVPLGLLSASAGCVGGSDAEAVEGSVEATAAVAQADVLVPPAPVGPVGPVDSFGPVGSGLPPLTPEALVDICPTVTPGAPLWPVCLSFFGPDDGLGDPGFDDGGYGGFAFPGVAGFDGFGHGHGDGDGHGGDNGHGGDLGQGSGSGSGHWGSSGGHGDGGHAH